MSANEPGVLIRQQGISQQNFVPNYEHFLIFICVSLLDIQTKFSEFSIFLTSEVLFYASYFLSYLSILQSDVFHHAVKTSIRELNQRLIKKMMERKWTENENPKYSHFYFKIRIFLHIYSRKILLISRIGLVDSGIEGLRFENVTNN